MTDIKFPKLVTKFVNGISYTAIDKEEEGNTNSKTKSASVQDANKKPAWIMLAEHYDRYGVTA